ncbi:MAG: DUF488 domain-containing protein [Rhodobacteraceae bacterium]|nr:DUF488 domain-containing protein [Paracoccaceae bacterium]
MNENVLSILTIGHSNHTMEMFLQLLDRHHVSALADVRSAPYSRFNPQFNREQLAKCLKNSRIEYVYLGRELGGRSDDPSCYEHGRIRYDRLSRTPSFHEGLKRLVRRAEEYDIALMCAEKEPLHCHRTLLVGHELNKMHGVDVTHILPDGRLEPHKDTMNRLLAKFKHLREEDWFKSRDERISDAIAFQTERVGHKNDQFLT